MNSCTDIFNGNEVGSSNDLEWDGTQFASPQEERGFQQQAIAEVEATPVMKGFGNMLTSMRCGDDLTGSTNEDLTISKAGGETIGYYLPNSGTGATVSGGLGSSIGSDRDVWGCLSAAESKMARSVVSIFLFDGDTIVFTCSGIPVECNLSYIRVLTSANLAMAMTENARNPGPPMRIEVHDAFNNIAPGFFEHPELEHGTAFVIATQFLDVCKVHLRHAVEVRPLNDLIAIQLTDSGAMPVKGVLSEDSSTFKREEVLCKAGDGGPLFDLDGNFVGMSLLFGKGSYAFVQRSVIADRMEQFEKWVELRARRLLPYRPKCTGEKRLRQEKYVLI